MTSWDVGSDGLTAATTILSYDDVIWPTDPTAGAPAAFPVQELPDDFLRMEADDGGVTLMDTSGGTLANKFVDIQRWGKI